MFLDEAEALTHPYLARCWARRGADLRIQAPGRAKRRAPLGALDPVRRRVLVRTSATKRSADFIALLDDLGAACGTAGRTHPLIAVADNGPIHTSERTAQALAERPWLTIERLPAYAPGAERHRAPLARPQAAPARRPDLHRCRRPRSRHPRSGRATRP